MARYPTIDVPPTALDSNPLPYQRLEAPPTAFGGREAQALGKFSDVVQQGIANYRSQLVQPPAPSDLAQRNAVERFTLDAQHHYANFSSLRHAEAIQGLPEYQQALQDSRDAVLNNLPTAIRPQVQPYLDQLHNASLRQGLEHRTRQDHAWSDHSSQNSLDVDLQEALLWRNNPIKVSRVAERGIGEWFKIGERKGWNEQQLGEQISQWNGRLYGTVIGQHLHDGNIEGAQTLLANAEHRVDPDTFARLNTQVAAGARRVEAQRNAPLMARFDGAAPNRIDYDTMLDMMRNKQIPEQDQPYGNTNPMLGENANVRPEDVQMRGPGGQQFAQVQTPSNANDRGDTLDGQIGPQVAQKPSVQAVEKLQPPAVAPLADPAKMKNVQRGMQADNPTPRGRQVAKPPPDSNDVHMSGEGQAQQKEMVDPKARDEQLDLLVGRGISGRLGNGRNNPGNLDAGDGKPRWEGMGDANGRFVQPNAPDLGVRMNAINLRSYADGLKNGTLLKWQQVLSKVKIDGAPAFITSLPFTIRHVAFIWAPKGDGKNDPNAWATGVAKISGLGADQELDPNDEGTLVKFVKGMNIQEHGSQTISDEDIVRGVRMALNYKTNRNLPIQEKTVEKRRQEIHDNVMNGIDELYLTPEQNKKFKDQANKKLNDEFRKVDDLRGKK